MSLASDLIDHRIALMRHDAWLRREVDKRLTPALQAAMEKALAGQKLSGRKLKQLIAAIDSTLAETYGAIAVDANRAVQALFAAEVPMLAAVYARAGVKLAIPKSLDFPARFTLNGAGLDEWWQRQGADTAFQFKRILREGMANGDVYETMARHFRQRIEMSRREAMTLVRTAVAAAAGEAHTVLRDNNRDILQGEKHLSTLDSRTSSVCRSRDGLMWDLAQQPMGHDVPYKRPPLHPNCRSVMLLVTKYSGEGGKTTRASADGEADAKMTYEDWLKGKSGQEQEAILGKGKAQMWREGKITLRDMLDQTGRELSLKELIEAHGDTNVSKTAEAMFVKSAAAEPTITKALKQVSEDAGAKMAGLAYRLKTQASLARKIRADAGAKKITAAQAAESINDALRYTMVFSGQKFIEQYTYVRSALLKQGFTWVKVKNTWQDGAVYKGVNTVLEYQKQRFELQFHTKESFALKNGKLHELYEKARLPTAAPEEIMRLTAEMKALSAQLPPPADIDKVK